MWDNGNVQIEYVTLHDSIRLRKGYFESGNIKLTVEVYQQWNYDTVYSENLITGEMTMEVLIEYADILEGNFEGYHNTTRLLIKCLLRSYTGCV